MQHLPYRLCAGIMLVNKDGLIFAGERIDTPGAWQMPQGGINDSEEALDAALRELTEETSVTAADVKLLGQMMDPVLYDLPQKLIGTLWGGKYCGQSQYWFKMQLEAPDSVINIKTNDPEFSQWKWMTPDELIVSIVDFKRPVYREVFESFLDT